MNQFDTAPSCVQNAMMTKDKKPFTYTPGGIDLSQIKSPRMAKRIARNAQNEGVTGQSRPSPLAKPNGTENGNHSPSISMGAAAMGMPFQVFPTPPPPPPQQRTNGNIPPPPPPSNLAAPSKPTANNARKSPTPQSFEPPPMGFRPEIKIPTNPMAALKKVPKPQEKNDFWVEEYKKERSKSPMVERNDNVPNQQSNIESAQPEPQQQQFRQEPVGNGVSPQQEEVSSTINGNQFSNGNQFNNVNEDCNGNSVEENGTNENESIVTGTPVQKTRDEVDQGQQQQVYRRSFENKAPSPQVFNHVSAPTPSPTKVFTPQNSSPLQSPAASSSPKPNNFNEPSPAASPAVQSSPKPIFNNVSPSPPAQQSPRPTFTSVTPPTPSPTVQAQPSPKPNMIYNNVSRDTMSPFNRGMSPQPQPQQYGSPIQQSFQQPQKNVSIIILDYKI